MTVCQMMTGSGGWPLTIIMTSDKKPFYSATYIPKETRYGRIGMGELIPRINEYWSSRREELERVTNDLNCNFSILSSILIFYSSQRSNM